MQSSETWIGLLIGYYVLLMGNIRVIRIGPGFINSAKTPSSCWRYLLG